MPFSLLDEKADVKSIHAFHRLNRSCAESSPGEASTAEATSSP
jgi:hypothetical protein